MSDYEGLQETYYLMSSPKNAEMLLEAIKELNEGGGIVRASFEPEE
jgi:antitoxin YefM